MVTANTVSGFTPRGVTFGWIGESWRIFSANAGVWVPTLLVGLIIEVGVALVLMFVLSLLGAMGAFWRLIAPTSALATGAPASTSVIGIMVIMLVVLIAVQAFISCGLYKIANAQIRGHRTELSMLFSGAKEMPAFFGLSLISLIISEIPALLIRAMPSAGSSSAGNFGAMILVQLIGSLISLLVAVWLLPGYALVADGIGAWTAAIRSVKGMGRYTFIGLLFFIVFSIIMVLSCIPCGLGLLATAPMLFIISSLCYRDVVGMPMLDAPVDTLQYTAVPGAWPPPPTAPSQNPWSPPPTAAPPAAPPATPWPPTSAPPAVPDDDHQAEPGADSWNKPSVDAPAAHDGDGQDGDQAEHRGS